MCVWVCVDARDMSKVDCLAKRILDAMRCEARWGWFTLPICWVASRTIWNRLWQHDHSIGHKSDHYKRALNIVNCYNKVDNIGVHAINAYNRKWPQIHTLTTTTTANNNNRPTGNDDDNFSSSQQVKINETWYTNNSSRQTINWISSSTHLLVRPFSLPLSLNNCGPIGCDA